MNTGSWANPGQQISQFEDVTLAFSGNRFDLSLSHNKQLGWSASPKVLHHDKRLDGSVVERPCKYMTAVVKKLHPNVVTTYSESFLTQGKSSSISSFDYWASEPAARIVIDEAIGSQEQKSLTTLVDPQMSARVSEQKS